MSQQRQEKKATHAEGVNVSSEHVEALGGGAVTGVLTSSLEAGSTTAAFAAILNASGYSYGAGASDMTLGETAALPSEVLGQSLEKVLPGLDTKGVPVASFQSTI